MEGWMGLHFTNRCLIVRVRGQNVAHARLSMKEHIPIYEDKFGEETVKVRVKTRWMVKGAPTEVGLLDIAKLLREWEWPVLPGSKWVENGMTTMVAGAERPPPAQSVWPEGLAFPLIIVEKVKKGQEAWRIRVPCHIKQKGEEKTKEKEEEAKTGEQGGKDQAAEEVPREQPVWESPESLKKMESALKDIKEEVKKGASHEVGEVEERAEHRFNKLEGQFQILQSTVEEAAASLTEVRKEVDSTAKAVQEGMVSHRKEIGELRAILELIEKNTAGTPQTGKKRPLSPGGDLREEQEEEKRLSTKKE